MRSAYGSVVLVTGASSGIGKATAEHLARNGFRVYGTSRSPQPVNSQPSGNDSGFLKMIRLDVCSEESVMQAVDYVVQQEGKINILINNAGFGIAGAVEDTTPEEAYKQFDTNFFGILRTCRAVLPVMRNQKNGLIVNVSSVAGLFSIPYQSMYSASKYALEAMTEALRIEVKPFGIKVAMVEPGDTKTGFTEKRQFVAAADTSLYKDKFTKAVNAMVRDEINGPSPDIVVKSIVKLIQSVNPPIRITVGFSYKLLVFLKRLFPSRLVEYIIAKLY